MTVFFSLSLYYSIRREEKLLDQTEAYISTLSYRVKKVGEEALLEMPIGIVLYDEEYQIDWANPFMNQFTEEETMVGEPLSLLSDSIVSQLREGKESFWLKFDQFEYQVYNKKRRTSPLLL